MSLGFEQAGFDILLAVEIDPVHCATYAYNFPHTQMLCGDITRLTGEELRQRSIIQSQNIDVVFGGPPCQGFSLMGKRVLDDPRNSLVFHFIRIVLELQPRYFVMENVKGMALGRHRKFVEEIITTLDAHGYQVRQPCRVLNAADYGIPQKRERLFILGCRRGEVLPDYPPSQSPPPQVWDALQDLPTIEDYPELHYQDWTIATFGVPSSYAQSLRNSAQGYAYQRFYNPQVLTSSLRTNHSRRSQSRFAATPAGTLEPVSRLFRLDPAGICPTLRAGTPSNRGGFTAPRPLHPHLPRCITVREAARLHSYPDWFRFHITKWHGCRQVGNSVPPLLAKAVAEEISSSLALSPVTPPGELTLTQTHLLTINMAQATKYYGVDRYVIGKRLKKM